MSHHIICPNQPRDNGIRVNETPLMYIPVEERNDISHSIVTNLLTIPLQWTEFIQVSIHEPP
jgi:hypothetical protein